MIIYNESAHMDLLSNRKPEIYLQLDNFALVVETWFGVLCPENFA